MDTTFEHLHTKRKKINGSMQTIFRIKSFNSVVNNSNLNWYNYIDIKCNLKAIVIVIRK